MWITRAEFKEDVFTIDYETFFFFFTKSHHARYSIKDGWLAVNEKHKKKLYNVLVEWNIDNPQLIDVDICTGARSSTNYTKIVYVEGLRTKIAMHKNDKVYSYPNGHEIYWDGWIKAQIMKKEFAFCG